MRTYSERDPSADYTRALQADINGLLRGWKRPVGYATDDDERERVCFLKMMLLFLMLAETGTAVFFQILTE